MAYLVAVENTFNRGKYHCTAGLLLTCLDSVVSVQQIFLLGQIQYS